MKNNQLKKAFFSVLNFLGNRWVVAFIFVTLLSFSALFRNIISWVCIVLFIILLFICLIYIIRDAKSKKVYIICFIISFIILSISLIFGVQELPAFPYNFGDAKKITSSEDLIFCVEHKIHNISIMIDNIEYTPYYEEIKVELNHYELKGQKNYYYSIVSMDNINILLKHRDETFNAVGEMNVFLSNLEPTDEKVYNKLSSKELANAVLVYDTDLLNSELLNSRVWVILVLLSCILYLLLSIYIAMCYFKQYSLITTINNNIVSGLKTARKKGTVAKEGKYSKQQKDCQQQLELLKELGSYNYSVISKLNITSIDEGDKAVLSTNMAYCYNNTLNKFCQEIEMKIESISKKKDIDNIKCDIEKELSKITYWNSLLIKYVD